MRPHDNSAIIKKPQDLLEYDKFPEQQAKARSHPKRARRWLMTAFREMLCLLKLCDLGRGKKLESPDSRSIGAVAATLLLLLPLPLFACGTGGSALLSYLMGCESYRVRSDTTVTTWSSCGGLHLHGYGTGVQHFEFLIGSCGYSLLYYQEVDNKRIKIFDNFPCFILLPSKI